MFYWFGAHFVLPSFPTRRSSDLRRSHRDALVGARAVRRPAALRDGERRRIRRRPAADRPAGRPRAARRDRKSTRLNSSHANISYAVFWLKKKTTKSNEAHGVKQE